MKRISVAAAVIYNAAGNEILISLRPADKHQGNLWEFPGGKIEAGESARAALFRELSEELGIVPLTVEPLLTTEHDYTDKRVKLDVWNVWTFEGQPRGVEQQKIRWVPLIELRQYAFPAANEVILDAVARSVD